MTYSVSARVRHHRGADGGDRGGRLLSRSVVWRDDGTIDLESTEVPSLDSHDVRVRVAYAGICGSDLKMLHGDWEGAKRGRVMGHEGSGVVEGVGPSVSDIEIGARVTWEPTAACRECDDCRRGCPGLCTHRLRHGGCWAEWVVLPRSAVFVLPRDVDLQVGALAEPLACALHAYELGHVPTGASVAIVGGGTIGMMLACLASMLGARSVVVVSRQQTKEGVAVALGASALVTTDTVAGVRGACDGGPEIVFEAAGTAASTQLALALPMRGGRVVIVGAGDTNAVVQMRPHEIFERALAIVGSYAHGNDMGRAVGLLHKVDLRAIITDVFPLVDVDAALARAATGGIKVLLDTGPT